MNVVYVITGLSTGGAETALYRLLSRLNRDRLTPVVISLMDHGTLGEKIEALGVPVYTLGMQAGSPTLAAMWQLFQRIRQLQPDIIQGWMYHGNLAAQLAGTLTWSPIPVLWNIRQTVSSLSHEKTGTAIVIKLLAQMGHFPQKVLYNSQASASQHEQLGYPASKTLVIPNGFDTTTFKPSPESRASVRIELHLAAETLLIGRIARFHPMKDYPNFLRAAALLLKEYPNVHFLLAGHGVDWQNQPLSQLIHQLNLNERIHLLGERQDTPRLTAALDIACTSSFYGEAFPNVIGEAMACEVPCVVTDVGDSGWIVGSTGRVVAPQDSAALANAWKQLIELGADDRTTLGRAARDRIIDHFSLDSVVAQYESLYDAVLANHSTKR